MDVPMKLLSTAEASLDPGLISAAGICPHMKDENMGTIRLCHKLSLLLQPVPRHKIAKNLPCFQQWVTPFSDLGVSNMLTLDISQVGCKVITPSNQLSSRPRKA